jgi:hypothetical protein
MNNESAPSSAVRKIVFVPRLVGPVFPFKFPFDCRRLAPSVVPELEFVATIILDQYYCASKDWQRVGGIADKDGRKGPPLASMPLLRLSTHAWDSG